MTIFDDEASSKHLLTRYRIELHSGRYHLNVKGAVFFPTPVIVHAPRFIRLQWSYLSSYVSPKIQLPFPSLVIIVPIANPHSIYEEFPPKGSADPASVVITSRTNSFTSIASLTSKMSKKKIDSLILWCSLDTALLASCQTGLSRFRLSPAGEPVWDAAANKRRVSRPFNKPKMVNNPKKSPYLGRVDMLYAGTPVSQLDFASCLSNYLSKYASSSQSRAVPALIHVVCGPGDWAILMTQSMQAPFLRSERFFSRLSTASGWVLLLLVPSVLFCLHLSLGL